MAWPAGADIRASLATEDPSVTTEQCQAFVDEWKGLIADAEGADGEPTETAAARRIVRRGAWADAMEQHMVDSGYVGDPEAISNVREWAEKALERYDASRSTPAEQEREIPQGYTGIMAW